MEEYVFQDMFEWLTSPARGQRKSRVKKSILDEDINYTIRFSENNKENFFSKVTITLNTAPRIEGACQVSDLLGKFI